MSMIQEISAQGLERAELGKNSEYAQIGGSRIPYEPRALAGMITTIRGFNPQRYLALEGESDGGWRYIVQATRIPFATGIEKGIDEKDLRKRLRSKSAEDGMSEPFDLISVDPRDLHLSADEIWKYLEGGKAPVTKFGQGAPVDYGAKKYKAGTLLIVNLSSPEGRDLYFKIRTMDNKMHQSQWAGMVKL